MKPRLSLYVSALSIVSVAALGGCSTAQPRPQTPTLTHADAPAACPLGVAGASVVAEDTPDGITLSFRSQDRPGQMRERANDAAAQHGQGQHLGLGHYGGQHSDGGDHGLQMMQMPPARSVAEDSEGGARIHFVAVDAVDTETLRTKLRARAKAMTIQPCGNRG